MGGKFPFDAEVFCLAILWCFAVLPGVHTFDMTRAKVTPSEVKVWKRMHKNGRSFSEIARAKGRSRQTVQQYCINQRVPERPLKNRILQAVKKLRRMSPLKRNIGCHLVAKELGLGRACVSKVMCKMDICERKEKLWLHPNTPEDPAKVYFQGRSQGWC